MDLLQNQTHLQHCIFFNLRHVNSQHVGYYSHLHRQQNAYINECDFPIISSEFTYSNKRKIYFKFIIPDKIYTIIREILYEFRLKSKR